MKTLCMDSAHKHLLIILMEDGKIVASSAKECWKKQSETLFPEMIALMEDVHWSADDLDEVVITDGPGSYTGVRIAMSVAKVLCTQKHIPLSCISTLQLYAGLAKDAFVMLDARSSRAYTALLSEGTFVKEESIMTIDEIKEYVKDKKCQMIGDTFLLDEKTVDIDFVKNFKDVLPYARNIENIHTVTPRYLKDQDAYKV